MDPERKRKIRLVVALTTAVLLATALVYTSFNASIETKEPSDLLAGTAGGSYEVTGKVVDGSVQREGVDLRFELSDRDDAAQKLPVDYTGEVPDPFREGREVIITGEVVEGTLVAEENSLITKCPSKFTEEAERDPNVIIDDSL